MKEINFIPVFQHIDQKFEENSKEIKTIKNSVDVLTISVDSYLKKGEEYRQEAMAMKPTLSRYGKWFKIIQEKLEINLEG